MIVYVLLETTTLLPACVRLDYSDSSYSTYSIPFVSDVLEISTKPFIYTELFVYSLLENIGNQRDQ